MERLGVNATLNAGAIYLNGKYYLVVRTEGLDRKSIFALASSENGLDNFRFESLIQWEDICEEETNIYDMRLVKHEDGYIYGIYCSERKDPDANFFVRLLGVFIYMFALSLTVILPKFTRLHLPYVSLFIDAIAALIVAFLPSDLNDFIALYPLYFAMAIQWCSFKGGDGFTCSTIFSTNNLRQFTTSITEYLCSKDPDALRKWKFFASVLLCFHFGVIVSYLSCKNFGHTGSLVCFLPVFSGFCLVWTRKHFVAVKHFIYHYLITPSKSSAYTTESE